MSGFQLVDLIVTELKKLHVEIQFLSLVEITAFRVESKSCKEFYLQINFPPMRALEFITN